MVLKSRIAFLSLATATIIFFLPGLAWPQSDNGEWKQLFNGVDLTGWTQRGGRANYSVEGDCIVGTPAPKTPNSFLCTEKIYGDFELELEFLVDPELNSGIQIRSESKPDVKNGIVHGYQVEIDVSDRAWTAGISDESRRGWLNDLSDNREDALTVRWKNIRIGENPPVIDTATSESNRAARTDSQSVFSEPANIVKLSEGFAFDEGPAMGPDGRVYFNDIPKAVTHVFDPVSGKTDVFRRDTENANGMCWTDHAGFTLRTRVMAIARQWKWRLKESILLPATEN